MTTIRQICETWFYGDVASDTLNIDELIETLEEREKTK